MSDWKHDGVRVIPAGQLDGNTAQTPGMDRKAAINFARVGAQKLWAGTVTIHARGRGNVGIELITGNDADAIMLPAIRVVAMGMIAVRMIMRVIMWMVVRT